MAPTRMRMGAVAVWGTERGWDGGREGGREGRKEGD